MEINGKSDCAELRNSWLLECDFYTFLVYSGGLTNLTLRFCDFFVPGWYSWGAVSETLLSPAEKKTGFLLFISLFYPTYTSK